MQNSTAPYTPAPDPLRPWEELFRAIVEQTNDGIVLADRQGCFLEVSQPGCALLGYPREDLLSLSWQQLISAEAQDAEPLRLNPAVGESIRQRYKIRRKDGSLHMLDIQMRAVTDGSLLSIICDGGESRSVETALQESEERYRLLAENVTDVIWVLDLTTSKFRYVSPSIERLRGYSVEEALSEAMENSLAPASLAYLASVLPERIALFQAGERISYIDELEQPRKDGTTIWVEVNSRFVINEANGHLETYGVSRDISERRRAEEILQGYLERLRTLHLIDRAILEAQSPAQVAAMVLEHLRRLIPCHRALVFARDANADSMRVLAFSGDTPGAMAPGEMTLFTESERPFLEMRAPWFTADVLAMPALAYHVPMLARFGVRSLLTIPIFTQSGLFGALVLTSPEVAVFTDEHLKIASEVSDQMAVALHNVHLLVQLQQERAELTRRVDERTADLSAANADLARAARLKDEFLANMSHELRTPLNTILGRSELLREQLYGPLSERQVAAIKSIEESGRHLLDLINDILDLSKVEAGKLSLDLGSVEAEVVGRAAVRMVSQAALHKHISLTATYDSLAEPLIADERRLKQILVNLLSNAVKFTPEGGKVGLEMRGDPDAQTVIFTIWDTGIGIAQEDQLRLFQPFVQLDSSLNRQYAGTGLGLSLVLRLTEMHGGSVALESTLGEGSRFSVVLPWARRGDLPPLPDLPAPADETPLGPIRQALIIDDSPSAAEQITRYLREIGSEVEVHDRATGAVERALALQPDVIVLDILLPDQSGWEVLRRLKADPRTAAIPVVMISVVDNPAYGRSLGASAYLLKPVTREVFLGALSALRLPTAPKTLVVVAGSMEERPLILLAEDNEENILVLKDYLSSMGYTVLVARNGVEALVQSEERRPALILMDIQMPVMDGLEAIRRIRAAGLHKVPIIALTALAMRGDRERCLEAGANDYLAKPVRLRNLATTIASLLEPPGSTPGSPSS